MLMSKEEILARRLPVERISIPWVNGGERYLNVRALPIHLQQQANGLDKGVNADAWIFVRAVVDDTGKRMFKDEDADNIAETIEDALLKVVAFAAYRLAQPTKEQAEAIKKNYESLRPANSGESPSLSDTPTPI